MTRLEGTTATVCRYRADTLRAMAHPARFFMLEVIAAGERCVCELQELVGLDLSTVSKHLTVLRNAGLVTDVRRGKNVYYRLCCPEAVALLASLEGGLDALARHQEECLAAACGGHAPDREI